MPAASRPERHTRPSGPAAGTFGDDVLAVLRALRPGQVVTYGEVAAEAGRPGAARAVGNLLRELSDVPWWRVVAANGRVNPNAVAEATRRLAAEGVEVRDARVVRPRRPAADVDWRSGGPGRLRLPRRGSVAMSDDAGDLPDDSPVDERSGPTVEDAIEEATRDSDHGGVLTPPERARSGEAPVEQVRGDDDMTGG
ncbi:MAG TPA: MGMT family protein [Euzebyales bacterium]|nr:MGMT family protein [Euzebyales bacterium]